MRAKWKNFMLDESGQTTTEYILILAVVVTMIMQFKKRFMDMLNRMFSNLDNEIQEDIFSQ